MCRITKPIWALALVLTLGSCGDGAFEDLDDNVDGSLVEDGSLIDATADGVLTDTPENDTPQSGETEQDVISDIEDITDTSPMDASIPCTAPSDCPESKDPCADPVCTEKGECSLEQRATGASCDDDDPCSGDGTCDDAGTCLPGDATNCDDNDPCTIDSCSKQSGCSNQPTAGDCDDGDACTTGDSCESGTCKGAAAKDCDDSNPCTDDTCDPKTGCSNANNNNGCDDGDACTNDDACKDGACKSGQALR
ncbi:MAG TPA: hypothetical protein DCQ06_09985 [Myxococcales bacterium]|nr:hypothetical protein [Myxococcales bacterium]